MIGSLGEFMGLQTSSILAAQSADCGQQSPLRPIRRRGRSTLDNYTPQDKTDLLIQYQKNNIYHINRRKPNSIQQEAHSRQPFKRPLYQHLSFFVQPGLVNDYISKEQLKRKHNLLRAIMQLKKSEEQPKRESDYQQSFQRLYSGFNSIHLHPNMERKEVHSLGQQISGNRQLASLSHRRSKSNLPNKKRLQFQHCLSWAKKHNKEGGYFAEQLGKIEKRTHDYTPVLNRSLIEEIGKQLDLSWLE